MTDLKVIDGEPKPVKPVGECEALFNRAYSEWLSVNADIAKFNAGDHECATQEDQEEMNGKLCDRRKDAEWRLVTTPAIAPWQFMQKFESLETIINRSEYEGYMADNRHVFMLTSVKADLWSFQLKRRG